MGLESTEEIIKSGRSDFAIKGKWARILVVDDELPVRDFLRDALLGCNYLVDVAGSCEEAFRKIGSVNYDLVLSDISLPGSEPDSVLSYCRDNSRSTQVILITGDPDLDDAVRAVKQGAFDYLSKPISPEKLIERVESALVHASKAHSTASEMGSPHKAYEVVRTLGAGNMGVVLLVKKGKHYYAMKILRRENSSREHRTKVQRFIREAEILSKIDHPNVIKIFEYGVSEDEQIPYIVMEFIPGRALNQIIRSANFSNEQSMYIIRQLAEALATVHKFGILHRDIKPGNILITDDLKIKLTDFGIAKIEDSELTITREVLGSPAYMSPESFENSVKCDCRSDIFSMGVIAYELLTGVKPFHGETIGEMMNSIKHHRPIEPLKINNSFPPYLQDVLAKMLAKKPDERFSSADEILKALDYQDARSQGKEGFTQKLLRTLLLRKPTWE
ncbi:MAG: protein kinase [Victivallales bacterium]|nr:protein kinase [Victivallales bacterium]